jgi:hypothetical protein
VRVGADGSGAACYRHRRSPDHAGHPFTEKGNQARFLGISWRCKLRLQPALRRGVASLNGRHIYGEAFITGHSSERGTRGG